MEQTLVYTNTTKPMSRCYPNPPLLVQKHEILIDEPLNKQKGSSFPSQKQSSSPGFIEKGAERILVVAKDEEDDVEDEENEFKMGRLIRQASLNSSNISTPRQTNKVLAGSTSLPRHLSKKPEMNREKIMKMRKVESMNDRNRNKSSQKIGKNNSGAPSPLIPRGWVDKGSSEDMKAQIKFWARSVASNLHQEC